MLSSLILRRLVACGACCALLSACEPLPVTVHIKPKPGAPAAAGSNAESAAAPAGYGTLTGTVTWTGGMPTLPAVVSKGDASKKDASVCAAVTIPDESLVVDADSKGIQNVVIFLAKAPANIKPELKDPPTDAKYFDQKGCRFKPHVLAVRVKQPLLVVSEDDISHNTHTLPSRNTPFNSVIAANDRKGVPCTYAKPESAPIGVVCDLHSWMKAYHFPVDHPYVAVTDEKGRFTIEGLPAGKHTFRVWQERGGMLEAKLAIEIQPDKETKHDLSYGADKIAAVPAAVRTLDVAALRRGGSVTLDD